MIINNRNTSSCPSSSVDSATTSRHDSPCYSQSVSSTTFKSSSIPISDRLARTASEVQLCLDEATADRLDYEFYSRVVTGISQSQGGSKSWQCRQENQMCLLHIMQTRQNATKKEEAQDEWAIGHSLEAPQDDDLIQKITSEASALSMQDEDDGIFEMDL